MEVLHQLQAGLVQIQVKLSRMNAPPNDSIKATKRKALMELFEDDSLREKETQDLYIDEESQEEVYKSQPLEISIVMPPPIKHDHIYEDPMWPTPPPPTLASFFHAHRARPSNPILVGAMCRQIPHLAKLESNHNQDPYVV
ncbi:hypothetical protein TIFTF001_030666 [Ficus carica]|uniref:Uncharacterized protein n=1 Tax=Ficus carica TaxID=3494 RepID=A0AA88J367_FICCA|nr:hypothetical protein TIFTF001_030666 [Ficus carica]